MICEQSETVYKFVRSDGGHEVGRLHWAGGKLVTRFGPRDLATLQPQEQVLFKPSCDGKLRFVEFGRLEVMPMRVD